MRNYFSLVFLGITLSCLVGCGSDRATLDIAGGQETIGASVVIDGEPSGTITKFGDDGARFAISVKKRQNEHRG